MTNHFTKKNCTKISGFIKIEQPDGSYKPDLMNIHVDGISAETHGQLDQFNPVFSPGSSSMASPGSPNSENSGGGKMARKKSTASTTSADEDDISNIPSLQTRIQIISQRVCSYYFFNELFCRDRKQLFSLPN